MHLGCHINVKSIINVWHHSSQIAAVVLYPSWWWWWWASLFFLLWWLNKLEQHGFSILAIMLDVWYTADPVMNLITPQFSLPVNNEVAGIFGVSWLGIAADVECICFLFSTLAWIFKRHVLWLRFFIVDGHVGPSIRICTQLWGVEPMASPVNHDSNVQLLVIAREKFKIVAIVVYTSDEKWKGIFDISCELNVMLVADRDE